MSLQRQKVADGVYVNCLPTDKFKVNAITVCIQTELNDNSAAMCALAAKVLMRGSEKYPDMRAIERRTDELYAAELSASGTRYGEVQCITLSADFLSSEYTEGDIIPDIVALIGSLLCEPLVENNGFKVDYTESEKRNLTELIRSLGDNKRLYAQKRCAEEMCANEAYSIPAYGRIETVEKADAASLYAFYKELLCSSPIEILYTGDLSAFEEICSCFGTLFSKIKRAKEYRRYVTVMHKRADSAREVCENMEISQGKLSIGLSTGITGNHEMIPGLIVANEILGGSASSKLFMNVREKMSLCYYCSSTVERSKGLMFINAGIENGNYEIAKNAIIAQLDAVKQGNFTDGEFDSAKSSLINAYRSVSDSVAAIESWYLPRIMLGDSTTPEKRVAEVASTARDEVIKAISEVRPEIFYFLKGTSDDSEVSDDEL